MIARTSWLRRADFGDWREWQGNMPVCDFGLRRYVRIPRGTERLRFCASDRRPRDDRDVFEVLRHWPKDRHLHGVRWVNIDGEGSSMLPAQLAWWFVEKFPRWRTLFVWVEVE